ncbi:pup--ligase domain protein [Mycobacterium xenopi 3993]|nr:pup--ligase domain protein [Mycobacterium xenopi 3993]
MQRRIMGIETEFGVTCTFHGHRRLSPDEVARYLFRRVVSWAAAPTCFCATARGSTSTSAAIPNTPPPNATAWCSWSPMTVLANGCWKTCSSTPSSGLPTRASAATSTCSKTTPTRPATPMAVTRTT